MKCRYSLENVFFPATWPKNDSPYTSHLPLFRGFPFFQQKMDHGPHNLIINNSYVLKMKKKHAFRQKRTNANNMIFGYKEVKCTFGFLMSSFKIDWRVNRSSLNKTAVCAGAVSFNHPSIVTIPICQKKC